MQISDIDIGVALKRRRENIVEVSVENAHSDILHFLGLVRIRTFRPDLTISEPWDEGDRFE